MDPLENYNQAMEYLANKFQEALKKALAKPYPFAPGFAGQKRATGIRNMTKQTGALYNSIQVSWNPDTQNVTVEMLDYWQYVNDGRRPGKYVPIKPLMRWIRAKGFNKNKQTGKFQKFNIKSTAFAISRSIKENGIQPTYFYDEAFKIFESEFENEAIRGLGLDIEKFFENVFEG
jgi:hypothetical protein